MSRVNRVISRIASCAVLLGASCVFAQDWPQWRGVNRDGKVTGFIAPATWPQQLTQKWLTTVGMGDATPALVNERLYVIARQGDDEIILCLDAGNGKELWRDKYPTPAPTGPDRSHPGPRSSPAVADGKVLALGVNGIFSCLNAATGKILWRKSDFPKGGTTGSPIVIDEAVIVHVGGKEKAAMMALDLATGKQKWTWAGDPPAHSSPVVMTVAGTKQIVTLTDAGIVGIAAADGKLLWQTPFQVEGNNFNVATPIIDGQTVIYTGQARGTKAVRIEKQGDGFAAKELWSNAELRTAFNTPVLKEGLLYGLSDRTNFFCINAKTGQAVWTDPTRRDRFGSIIDVGPVLLATPSNSELIVFKPSDKQYEEVARIRVSDTPIYAHPVVAGKRIFIKDKESLTMWAIE